MGRDILVIDDCAAAKETLNQLLRDDYKISFADTAREGLSLISDTTCLIFLDVLLPDANGIEVLREIKTETPSIPVIVTAAHSNEETCLMAFRGGARDYIRKPLEAAEVLNATETLTRVASPAQKRTNVFLTKKSDRKKPQHDIPAHIVKGIVRVKEHMESNYTEPLDLSDACKLAAISKTYFCAYFKRITGHSFKSYYNYIKIQKARELMNDVTLSLSDIANFLGYANQSHFSTVFKKATGASPKTLKVSS
jgi:YesN/AraC family two-component response regulator